MAKINLMKFEEKNKNISKNKKQINKKIKKKSVIKSFLLGFFVTLIVVTSLLVISIFAYNKLIYTGIGQGFIDQKNSLIFKNTEGVVVTPIPENKKIKYNFVLLGTDDVGSSDDSSRTDFIMIGQYNTKTNKVKVMSVPRDTYTVVNTDLLSQMQESSPSYGQPRSNGVMKITEVSHFAPENLRTDFTKEQLERTFNVDFDFYVKFNLVGFEYIVDKIGGVPFNVPQRMYYNDPGQNLHIDLYPGQQTLNGKQAEGLIRYREQDSVNPISSGYARGDIERIEVQHNFINALISQMTSTGNIPVTVTTLFSAAGKYLDTNIKATDLTIFIPFLNKFDTNNLEMYVMPNDVFSYKSGKEVTSMVKINQKETEKLILEIFYDDQIGNSEIKSSKNLSIEVLNGGYTTGLATKVSNKMKTDGYNVTSVGDYNLGKIDTTEIHVKNSSYGQDLQLYFNNSKIVLDNNIKTDIQVIIGKDAK